MTPQTERCYQNMISSFQYNFGVIIIGPSGCGKSESLKELAKYIAISCQVFNCSNEMDNFTVSNFFKGLVQSGMWCCFDEFDRVNIEQLSILASQIRSILQAIKEQKQRFFFEGMNIRLVQSCTIIATASHNRFLTETIPENLKSLFRVFMFNQPSLEQIIEVLFYSSGFSMAQKLTKKLIECIDLTKSFLKENDKIIFGLWMIKSIINHAQSTLKDNNISELVILKNSIEKILLPQLNQQELIILKRIIKDLFISIQSSEEQIKDNNEELIANYLQNYTQLKQETYLHNKIIQLMNLMNNKIGIIVYGNSLAGKSFIINTLKEFYSQQNYLINIKSINPRAQDQEQLFGYWVQENNQWQSGLLGLIFQDIVTKENIPIKNWILFDGPVVCEWVERFNTALDDSWIVSLNNGQCIKIQQGTSFVFETDSIQNASPATISRCGVIYLEPSDQASLIHIDFILSGLKKLKEANCNIIKEVLIYFKKFLNESFVSGLDIIKDMSLNNMLILFKAIYSNCQNQFNQQNENKQKNILVSILLQSFLIQTQLLGQDLEVTIQQLKFDLDQQQGQQSIENLKQIIGMEIVDSDIEKLYYQTQSFSWIKLSQQQEYCLLQNNQLYVPIQEQQQALLLSQILLDSNFNILFTSENSCGKSIFIKQLLQQQQLNKDIQLVKHSFKKNTNAQEIKDLFLQTMTSKLVKKNTWGPADGKSKIILYLENININSQGKQTDQQSIELLWKLLNTGTIFEQNSQKEIGFENNQILAELKSGINISQSINWVLRYFYYFNLKEPSYQSMYQIFDSYIEHYKLISNVNIQQILQELKPGLISFNLSLILGLKQIIKDKQQHSLAKGIIIDRFQFLLTKNILITEEKESFVQLWSSEIYSQFSEHLQSHKLNLKTMITTASKNYFNFETDFENNIWTSLNLYTKQRAKPMDQKEKYFQIKTNNDFKQYIKDLLQQYNLQSSFLFEPVLYDQLLSMLCQNISDLEFNNHLVFLGQNGSGKRTLSQLIAIILDYQLVSIDIDELYNTESIFLQLKNKIKQSGLNQAKYLLIFDNNLCQSEWLMDLIYFKFSQQNYQTIFDDSQLDKIISEIVNNKQIQLQNPSKDTYLQYFLDQIQTNFKIIFNLDLSQKSILKLQKNYPNIFGQQFIKHFQTINNNSLQEIAEQIIDSQLIDNNQKQIASKQLSQIYLQVQQQQSVVQQTQSLSCYIRALKQFNFTYCNQSQKLYQEKNKYVKGVQIFDQTKEQVDEMKALIAKLKPEIEETQKETQQLIFDVQKEQESVDKKRVIVEEEGKFCGINREKAEELRNACQEDLNKVLPILTAVMKHLNLINRSHIDFIKSIKKPLPAILKLFQGLCIVFQLKEIPMKASAKKSQKPVPDYTKAARTIIMAKPDKMLQELLQFNEEKINSLPGEVIQSLRQLVSQKDFDLAQINNISQEAEKIGLFLKTVVDVYEKLQIINPKRQLLWQAEKELLKAEAILQEKKDIYASYIERLWQIKDQLKQAQLKKEALEQQIATCTWRTNVSAQLIEGLATEKENWENKIKKYSIQEQCLLGDCILLSSQVNYTGIYEDYRRENLQQTWQQNLLNDQIQFTNGFNIQSQLCDEIAIGSWISKEQLPNDNFSIENSIFIKQSLSTCVIIDPQDQAAWWLMENLKNEKNYTIDSNTKEEDIRTYIKKSLANGFNLICLLKSKEINPYIIELLQSQIQNNNINEKIIYDNNLLQKHKQFRAYIFLTLSALQAHPFIYQISNVINFQVNTKGLEDNLLNMIIYKEDLSSERMRINSVKEYYELSRRQQKTEENILQLLQQQSGEALLDNIDLVNAFQKSKEESQNLSQRIKVIQSMRKKLQSTWQLYQKAAFIASQMFQVLIYMESLSSLYVFSLDQFNIIFKQSLNIQSQGGANWEAEIILNFIQKFFKEISISLSRKHKNIFCIQIYIQILFSQNIINEKQYKILLGTDEELNKITNNRVTDSLTKNQNIIKYLEGQFEELKDIVIFQKQILSWIDNKEIQTLPKYIQTKDLASELILIRLFKPTMLYQHIKSSEHNYLKNYMLSNEQFSLIDIYNNQPNTIPILFILSEGVDPITHLERLSKQLKQQTKIDVLSLAQNQEQLLGKFLKFAKDKGWWIILQNCHMCPQLLSNILSELQKIDTKDFRLFLSAKETKDFPLDLLKVSTKLYLEDDVQLSSSVIQNIQMTDAFGDNSLEYFQRELIYRTSLFHSELQNSLLKQESAFKLTSIDLLLSQSMILQICQQLKDQNVQISVIKYCLKAIVYQSQLKNSNYKQYYKQELSFIISYEQNQIENEQIKQLLQIGLSSLEKTKSKINEIYLLDVKNDFDQIQSKYIIEALDFVKQQQAYSLNISKIELIRILEDYQKQLPDLLQQNTEQFMQESEQYLIQFCINKEIDCVNKNVQIIQSRFKELINCFKNHLKLDNEKVQSVQFILNQKMPVKWLLQLDVQCQDLNEFFDIIQQWIQYLKSIEVISTSNNFELDKFGDKQSLIDTVKLLYLEKNRAEYQNVIVEINLKGDQNHKQNKLLITKTLFADKNSIFFNSGKDPFILNASQLLDPQAYQILQLVNPYTQEQLQESIYFSLDQLEHQNNTAALQ